MKLANGVKIRWDGKTRVYVSLPPSQRSKVMGLCGTFNGNQNADFLTVRGTVEQNPIAFGKFEN